MNIRSVLFLTLLLSLEFVPPIRAQIVNDGASRTLSNVTNTITGTVTVGTNGSFTLLTLADNALLTNSAHGVIGRNATARSNEVRLVSPTARWLMGGNFFVGSNGAMNRLVVSNGAFLNNNNGLVGNGAASSNNFALVTGSGSFWSNRIDLTVGVSGRDNQLIVSNGARVTGRVGNLGGQPGGSNNLVVVTGDGSVWTNSSDVNVGVGERGNRLVIEAGGLVAGDNGRVGAGGFGSNEALVTGPGSLWSSRTDLAVGLNPPNNRLVISNGAAVAAGRNGRVGPSTPATNNVVLVTGAGSLWSSQFELHLGEASGWNRVEVNSGGRVVSSNSYVGNLGGSNFALVTGTGSVWSNRADLYVGLSSSANQLVASNGATVLSSNATIGLNAGAINNLAVVTGAGSVWNNRADFDVGGNSAGNRLDVAGGGTALTGGHGTIGLTLGANSNTVFVADAGSRWLVTSNLFVGNEGAFNRLVVSNGGFAGSEFSVVGSESTASNNVAWVTGLGSIWTNSILELGWNGQDNQLVMTNGGSVISRTGSMGKSAGANRNQCVVTGPGSAWRLAENLFVGFNASANRLVVSNAGQVVNDLGVIGLFGHSNEVTVTGASSLWSNRFHLNVGSFASANRLVIQNGGTVYGSNVFVGASADSTNNRVLVNGGTLRATHASGTSALDVQRGTNALNAGLVDVDNLVLTNKGAILFGNAGSIVATNNGVGTPYPSTIAVGGYSGVVTNVTVTLSALSIPFPERLDILLVSPAGQKVMLMSDAGGLNNIVGVTLSFDDAAGTTLPFGASGTITTGTYRPTDHQPGENMPAPAPAGPFSTTLSSFNGSSPNGVWRLFVVNDSGGSPSGTIGGWTLRIQTDGLSPNPGVFEFNGGTLVTRGASINNAGPFVVGGPGGVPAVWELRPGANVHVVASDVIVGSLASSNNLLRLAGSTFRAPTLDIRGGTNRLDAGLEDVARLTVTNARGHIEFNGGTLRTPDTTIANGRVLTVGNGASTATLQLLGGTHTFANNLAIAANASLIGQGTIDGTVTVSAGGRLIPGAPIGRIDVLGTVILQGAVNLQIDKSGGVRTSDQVTASGAIFYGGALNVTHIGTDELAAGDRFVLFTAAPYVGAFSAITLPPLGAGLDWRNNLLVDGSIEVVTAATRQPGFASVTMSGTNVVLSGTNGTPGTPYAVLTSTNVALPLSNWLSIATNQFGTSGAFSFTNPVAPGDRQRFFRLRAP
jgi:T5SS/PEP-CTERM-associated repeat protein